MMPSTAAVLSDLRHHYEYRVTDAGKVWGAIYLPHARPPTMAWSAFEAHLAELVRLGLYRETADPEVGEVAVETSG